MPVSAAEKQDMPERILIGLDDTDTPGGRGTGFQAMQLSEMIGLNGLGEVRAISRHQLLRGAALAPTSDNSSACIELHSGDIDRLTSFCIQFIRNESAQDAHPGICISAWDAVSTPLIEWGRQAKTHILTIEDALHLARHHGILVDGRSADSAGIIGAMAAVGLRRSGFDGRFLWLERLRDLTGIYSAEDLVALVRADAIRSANGEPLHPEALVEVGEWFRPVNIHHQITIIVEPHPDATAAQWRTASRETTMLFSDLSL